MFRRIFFAAVLSGAVAGVFASVVQSVGVIPLIRQAEKFELREEAPASAHKAGEARAGGGRGVFPRAALTLVSNVLSGVGFALLLAACFALRGGVGWREAILWGLGGFLAFGLSPALGLPPKLPGAFAALLPERQLWWLLAAAGASSGLLLLAFKRGAAFKALGVAFIASPHLLGAPFPESSGGSAPEALAEAFILPTLAASAAFWIVLGLCAGYFFNRLKGK